MSPFDFAVGVLAAYRLTNCWFERIAAPLRDPLARRSGWVGYLATCALCISVWASAAVLGLWVLPGGHWLVWGLAISAGVITYNQWMTRLGAPNPVAYEFARLNDSIAQQQGSRGHVVTTNGR